MRAALASLLAVLTLGAPASGDVFVRGGGPYKRDCFLGWRIAGVGPLLRRQSSFGKTIDCRDGESGCDLDGTVDGKCTFDVSLCVLEPGIRRCDPATAGGIRKITVTRYDAVRNAGIPRLRGPHLPATSTGCGSPVRATVPLRVWPGGRRRTGKLKFMKAEALATAPSPITGHPQTDRDVLELRCLPGLYDCSGEPNLAGGPSVLTLTTSDRAPSDVDLSWDGLAQDKPFVTGARLAFCLSDCDRDTRTTCTGVARVAVPFDTFGPPQPVLLGPLPVCLVHRFGGEPTLTADRTTGEIAVDIPLLTDVYLTTRDFQGDKGLVCPQCSAPTVGSSGVCIGGSTPGVPCPTEGTSFVADGSGVTPYKLSSSCRPAGVPLATLPLTLPLHTGTTTLAGPLPCPKQTADDSCSSDATCDALCTGSACSAFVADPAAPGHVVCVDHGGLAQVCCSNDTGIPCHPTRYGGTLVRSGVPAPLVPDVAGVMFPATATPVLAGAACPEPAPHIPVLNRVSPGPFTVVLPVTARWSP